MGKAYTEEERKEIRRKLLEAGLDLFHDQGVRKLSIGELTKRAGIAQGGFYSFFPNKDALIIEIMHHRSRQKLDLFEKTFDQSLHDPAAFTGESILRIAWDLKRKADQKQMYADVLQLCLKNQSPERERLYGDFSAILEKLAVYWNDQGLEVFVDRRGMLNVLKGFLALFAQLNQLDEEYSQPILQTFLVENCRKYIVCGKTEGGR